MLVPVLLLPAGAYPVTPPPTRINQDSVILEGNTDLIEFLLGRHQHLGSTSSLAVVVG